MKYAHIADCHIGSWRDAKMAELSTKAFTKTIDTCIKENVDFVLISGDLFNTSLPSIDRLKEVTKKLKQLKDQNIATYIIAGSHDFSPSGKTMLDVLENAGLVINVVKGEAEHNKLKLKFTIDPKTGAKITGMLGKKGMLEKNYYEALDKKNLEEEQGYKIFMFHTALTEFKPEEMEKMDSTPISFLPKGFNYYAGGHVHYIFHKKEKEYGMIAYPGALFPNNFSELQKYGHGGFYIVQEHELTYVPIKIYDTTNIEVDCEHKTPEKIEKELMHEINKHELKNKIVMIKLEGTIESGKTSDIHFNEIFDKAYQKDAYFVMKNTNQLKSKELEQINIDTTNTEEIEEKIIKEHLGQIKLEEMNSEEEERLTKQFMKILNTEKQEGERVIDFEQRLKKELEKITKI